jgi:hypothetical protein
MRIFVFKSETNRLRAFAGDPDVSKRRASTVPGLVPGR